MADADREEEQDICPVVFPMAQATIPGGPRLPCSLKQALTLHQLLFQRPAGLGQLQTATEQVRKADGCFQRTSRWGPDTHDPHSRYKGWDGAPGLELPMTLLEMEQSLRAQEKVEASTYGGSRCRRQSGSPHFLVFHPHAASLGLGAADWGWAGPLLAPLGWSLWPERPGSAHTEPVQPILWQESRWGF